MAFDTHEIYLDERISPADEYPWQWDPQDPEETYFDQRVNRPPVPLFPQPDTIRLSPETIKMLDDLAEKAKQDRRDGITTRLRELCVDDYEEPLPFNGHILEESD